MNTNNQPKNEGIERLLADILNLNALSDTFLTAQLICTNFDIIADGGRERIDFLAKAYGMPKRVLEDLGQLPERERNWKTLAIVFSRFLGLTGIMDITEVPHERAMDTIREQFQEYGPLFMANALVLSFTKEG